MAKIYCCSFGSLNLAFSYPRFYQQALDMGIFSDIFIYNQTDLAQDFKDTFSRFFYEPLNNRSEPKNKRLNKALKSSAGGGTIL